MGDLRPPLDPIMSAFGESAVVTVPGGAPVSATAVRGEQSALYTGGGELAVSEQLTNFTLRRSEVASAPSGTTLVVGGRTWTVDSILRQDDELLVVTVR